MRMCKSIKRYVTVLEHTDPYHEVQIFRTLFATVDIRPFRREILFRTTGRNSRLLS